MAQKKTRLMFSPSNLPMIVHQHFYICLSEPQLQPELSYGPLIETVQSLYKVFSEELVLSPLPHRFGIIFGMASELASSLEVTSDLEKFLPFLGGEIKYRIRICAGCRHSSQPLSAVGSIYLTTVKNSVR